MYQVRQPAPDNGPLGRYVTEELQRIAAAFSDTVDFVQLNALGKALKKARQGVLLCADGSSYNPSSGEGVYFVNSAGLLKKLGPLQTGTATLSGGTVTVAFANITANSLIFLSRQATGGTLGHLSTTRSAGVSFTIASSSATETSTVAYLVIEP
jgi:hypothetical protein